jgi:OOP family OmpA-OmpF porin
MRFSQAAAPLLTLALAGCVSGNQIRASADVIKQDIERAKESGAMRCAPRELALAEANMNFALADLAQGASFTAREEIKEAEVSVKRALSLSKDCGKKQILVREKDPDPVVKPPPMVVKIEETDQDRDGLLDRDDKCPEQAEDKDAFQDEDGCPDPDNDGDDVLDTNDKCPLVRGPLSNQGCPEGPVKDTDGDGVPDNADKCPDQAEDKDSFRDEDGCPDPDNDEDGLVDGKDKCPDQAGPVENFGCPDVDKDGDGVADRLDKCPDEPEDKDGFEDKDGCPDLDNDQDGIPDAQDKCATKAGPAENEGCPDLDKDGDGVPDRLDKCPEEFGVKDEQGCQKKYKLVVVKKDRIEIKQQIKFKTGSAKIIGTDSFAIIAEVASAMRDNPQIKKIRVEGHTDSVGNDAANLKLSQERAGSVMAAMIKEGVDPARMEAVGYGETKPIASNSTKNGRAENRRTEFNIVEQ